MFQNNLVRSSLLLFIDQILVLAAGGWLYWLMVSKLTTSSAVGQATAVYSLVNLVAILAMVGLEYPLLKRSLENRGHILGTAILIQMLMAALLVPVVIFTIVNIYEDSANLIWIALLILISWPILLTTRFVLLGMSDSRTVLVIDSIATPLKFIAAYVLISQQLGSVGILASIMVFNIFLAAAGIYFARKIHGFSVGRIRNTFVLLKEGLSNLPVILSRTLIFTLSVVLLATLGVDNAQIGTFYIALMISLFAGALVTSNAYMVIPHSNASKSDLSLSGARVSLSLTVPIISILISVPSFILSLIGEQYVNGHLVLLILSIGMVPFSIVTLGISKLNYLGYYKLIVIVGVIQLLSLLIPFYILAPEYGIIGAALSIVISLIVASIPLVIWSEKKLLVYLANCCIAICGGWLASYAVSMIILSETDLVSLLQILVSFSVSSLLILCLKNTSVDELKSLIYLARGKMSANARPSD